MDEQVVAVDISDHMKPDPPADNLYIQVSNPTFSSTESI